MATDQEILAQIKSEIRAHGLWKRRLKKAIDQGKPDMEVKDIESDNLCQFGKWLASLSGESSSQYWDVKLKHALFHRKAAEVVKLAVDGEKLKAMKAIDSGGSYLQVSSELKEAMMNWEKELKAKRAA